MTGRTSTPPLSLPREQKIVVSFYGDDEAAKAIAEQMRVAVAALVQPTEENASALFRIGFEAIARKTAAEMDAGVDVVARAAT